VLRPHSESLPSLKATVQMASPHPTNAANLYKPRLDILPASQHQLRPKLDSVPSEFVLYAGTLPALQLGHRISEDFDSFSWRGMVKVAFFGGLNTLQRVDDRTGGWACHRREVRPEHDRKSVAVLWRRDGGPVPIGMQRDPTRWAQGVDEGKLLCQPTCAPVSRGPGQGFQRLRHCFLPPSHP
jgi:hypothetical protein